MLIQILFLLNFDMDGGKVQLMARPPKKGREWSLDL